MKDQNHEQNQTANLQIHVLSVLLLCLETKSGRGFPNSSTPKKETPPYITGKIMICLEVPALLDIPQHRVNNPVKRAL